MKKQIKKWFFSNLANFITTARLIFSVWLIFLAISSNQLFFMLVLVLLSGLTDLADGWTARRFRIESKFGSFLDRLTDKIFICPTIIILIYRFWEFTTINPGVKIFTESLIAIIFLLEIFLIISGIIGFFSGLDTSSNEWGKKKMAFQSIVIFLWFFSLNIEFYFKIKIFSYSIFLIDIMLILIIFLALKSIEDYLIRWYQK